MSIQTHKAANAEQERRLQAHTATMVHTIRSTSTSSDIRTRQRCERTREPFLLAITQILIRRAFDVLHESFVCCVCDARCTRVCICVWHYTKVHSYANGTEIEYVQTNTLPRDGFVYGCVRVCVCVWTCAIVNGRERPMPNLSGHVLIKHFRCSYIRNSVQKVFSEL